MSNEASTSNLDDPTPESSQMRWQFIDASDNRRSNLTQVKRHVMQEYIRQRRHGDQPSTGTEEPVKKNHDSQPRTRSRSKKRRSSAITGEAVKKGKSQGTKRIDLKPHSDQRDLVVADRNHALDDPGVEEIERLPATKPVSGAKSLPYRQAVIKAPISSDLIDSYTLNDHSSGSEPSIGTPLSSVPTSPFDLGLSPKTMLSAARTDPFNCLPMELDLEGQRLFDFYVNEMPACSYGTHFRSSRAHNWYTAVFVPEAMKGPIAFQNTILVHAANTWAWVRNEEETDYTLTHRSRAISMLRNHMIKNPGDVSDQVIIACLSAAGLEDFDPRLERKPISWMHMRAAREMIRARGGPAVFENTRLGMLINWQDYILSGYETHGPSLFFERHPLPRTLPEHSFPSVSSISSVSTENTSPMSGFRMSGMALPQPLDSPKEEIQQQCVEFVDFLKRCEQLAIHQHSICDESMPSMRRSAFQESSLLYEILAAPPALRFTASGNRKQLIARAVALIMLNAGLWDYRYSTQHSDTFLQTLQLAMFKSEVGISGSVEALLQIMLECNDGIVAMDNTFPHTPSLDAKVFPDFTQYSPTARTPFSRPWFAGRMLKIAKRLSLNSWISVQEFLFSCLTLQPMIGWVSSCEN
ncbi:sigma-70 region 2 family protein [Aspergillus tanneri]|uniref:Sigma-70 region 2 family protein n=1 Tax=Aspergillus tanneri TaxID=1220188 RepID=A0A5M9MP76_9EURO|nr:uncharacterized protein ATNIH1004_007736 [Aspergillus tanneri]KAA8646309.1 hypothetical protein ATNIH1004_007736 [Aspergillus tanneri]